MLIHFKMPIIVGDPDHIISVVLVQNEYCDLFWKKYLHLEVYTNCLKVNSIAIQAVKIDYLGSWFTSLGFTAPHKSAKWRSYVYIDSLLLVSINDPPEFCMR